MTVGVSWRELYNASEATAFPRGFSYPMGHSTKTKCVYTVFYVHMKCPYSGDVRFRNTLYTRMCLHKRRFESLIWRNMVQLYFTECIRNNLMKCYVILHYLCVVKRSIIKTVYLILLCILLNSMCRENLHLHWLVYCMTVFKLQLLPSANYSAVNKT
jgi:hypothetical protein